MTVMPPSEFGGKTQKNRVQPPPHKPTPAEELMLLYTTGDSTGAMQPDEGETFAGLIDYDQQLEIREAEGVMDKGQVWEEMQGQNQPGT